MKKIEIVNVKVSDLKPTQYNPRHWSDKSVKELIESVKRFGLIDPLIVNSAKNRKNVVIGGHFRLKVAKDLKFKEVPVVYLDIPDVKQEKELNLRLNKNLGEWDFKLLAEFDFSILAKVGFPKEEIELLAGKFKRGEFKEIIDKFKVKHESDKNQQWFYVEFYKDKKRFEELKKLLGSKLSKSGHEIDSDAFYKLVKRASK